MVTRDGRTLVIAVLGLGEAGSVIARDLTAAGTRVRGYDPASDTFRVDWKTAATPLGAVTVTARVSYPGGTARTRSSAVTLVR